MINPFKGITIHEGYNDIGSFEFNITEVEQEKNINFQNNSIPSAELGIYFSLKTSYGPNVPQNYKVTVLTGIVEEESQTFTEYPNQQGLIQVNTPLFPVSVLSTEELDFPKLIRLNVKSLLENRSEECYIKVYDSEEDEYLYTLITDLCFHETDSGLRQLSVFNGLDKYYAFEPSILIEDAVEAVCITKKGKLRGYRSDTNEWGAITTLTFRQIEFPAELESVADGFYRSTAGTGTITSGTFGTEGVFLNYKLILTNPEPYLIKCFITVYKQDGPDTIYTHLYKNLKQGSLDLNLITIDYIIPKPTDDSPTLGEIETVSGITFSEDFTNFLLSKELTTLELIRRAGPISYINDFPKDDVSPEELALLQGHVDFYSLNTDIDQNQYIMSAGYNNIYKIANTQKNVFVTAVSGTEVPLFKAAQFHEVVTQNQKLVRNLLAGTLTDLRLESPSIPNVSGSNFRATALSKATNSCGCDDCKSGISPFAYMMDLLKYSSAHISHNVSPTYSPASGTLTNFIELISDKFLQPFGTLNVDCETLHDEFCRVRLVTEILEKIVAASTSISPVQVQTLGNERKQFLLLVYQTILNYAGTSYNELRDVVATQPTDKKNIASQKLSTKLGIPLYVPSDTVLTVDRIWLTFNAADFAQELNAENLEIIFGFRDTLRDVLTPTPVSLMEDWHGVYMRDVWRKQDYAFTAYSREGVDPLNDSTIKDNWMPILDPDIIGREDFTYHTLPEAVAIWEHRKEDTDNFLQYFMTDSDVVSFTAVDIKNRILKVKDRNLVSQVLENNQILIPVSASTFIAFDVLNMKLNQTDTDIFLMQSASQPMIQPYDDLPVINYKRIVEVNSSFISGTTTVIITWPNDVIIDTVGSYVKLQSVSGATTIAFSTDGSTDIITNVVIDNPQQVTLTLNGAGLAAYPTFLSGTITYTYDVEVTLVSDILTDPKKVVADLYNEREYYFLPPVPVGIDDPFPYWVWDTWFDITADSEYEKLKLLQQFIAAGTATNDMLLVITDKLHMTKGIFNRMMTLLGITENYLDSMYTAKRPTNEELYELASIFRNSAKASLRKEWIKEEIKYLDIDGNPLKLMLDGKYFWKSIAEPVVGPWDMRLQTAPVIDPELIKYDDILLSPAAKPYRDLYDFRVSVLELAHEEFISMLIPQAANGFTDILNQVNTGFSGTPYDISPYTGPSAFANMVNDLQSNDAFLQKKAADVVTSAFAMTSSDFLAMVTVKDAYENINPAMAPTRAALDKAVSLLVSGYKRNRLYGGIGGWLHTETFGSVILTSGYPVKYYNVFNMKMAPGRGDIAIRKTWQQTLESWNRQPFIQPDLVPPENIKDFTAGNWVYTTWDSRNTALITEYNALALNFDNLNTAGTLFDNLKDQLDLLIQRVDTLIHVGSQDYLVYFTELKDRESNGEDIRPYLTQLGIAVTEYRFLANIYNVLENTPSGSASPLLDSECKDIIDIIIHIRSINLPFIKVQEEYSHDIILDQDFFQNYKPALSTFPLTDLHEYNSWRSPYAARKQWKDILETRIDKETNVKDKWKEVLEEAEDRNMPFLRDALIKALCNPCELISDAAERLAKTYFIETKDNCCVKHTRVSFALETLQGLLFALQNGVYDGFVSNFTISAPNFEKEWQWLGSYSTWRSAMFVFIFPENLLYPTLKRLQSPAFRKLAETIQFSNRFSPEDACEAAKEYQTYFNDVQNLQIVCSTTATSNVSINTTNSCCEDDSLISVLRTYFFAQGPSGIPYWSYKDSNDNSALAHSFWEPVPIEQKDIKLIGCFALGDRDATNSFPVSLSLLLFYTFSENQKLKMGYIKKDILKPGGIWKDEQETEDLPMYPGTSIAPYNVIACQDNQYPIHPFATGKEWNNPYFFLSYANINNTYNYNHVSYYYVWKDDKFDTLPISSSGKAVFSTTNLSYKTPILALTHHADSAMFMIFGRPFLTIAFPDFVKTMTTFNWPVNYNNTFLNVVGVFESPTEHETLIVVHKDASYVTQIKKIKFSLNNYTFDGTISSVTVTPGISYSKKIYPCFCYFTSQPTFALDYDLSNRKIGAQLTFPVSGPTTSSNIANKFALTPAYVADKLQSADCIPNMSVRAKNVKISVLFNMDIPPATSITSFVQTTAAKEVVYEAFYFVPMLLALDQQSRGQFEASLSWYRTVYDYTTNLKVFYGLVMEESITNSYLQAPNWLLDPLNPHLIAQTRINAYTRYTLMNIIQCMYGYADREFTKDTIESVPMARKLYTEALELSKSSALNLKPNTCNNLSVGCISVQVDGTLFERYGNLFGQLTEKLSQIGNATIIDGLVEDIVDLINTGTEDTYAQNFAEAFEMVETATPAPPAAEDVLDFMSGEVQRANDAYSYLRANDSASLFNEKVASSYASTIAVASGIVLEDLFAVESETQLSWLETTTSVNNAPYHFRYTNAETGKQFLPGELSFNLFQPTQRAFSANIAYNNLPNLIGTLNPSILSSYTPLIDFKFCIPNNPVYESLQLKGNLELYKIFNCRNIAGMVRELDVFAAATDSTTGMPIIGASGNLVLPGIGTFTPSQYRFATLIERAKQIAAQAQQMESLFLSALEKEDSENYNILKARQDLETAKATVKLQDLRITQANDEKGIADLQLGKAVFTQQHFTDLIATGLNQYETLSLQLLQTSAILQGVAAAVALAGSVSSALDTRTSAGTIVGLVGEAASYGSQITTTLSSMNVQLASYERRSEEWAFQKDLAGLDISISNQQLKVAQDNVRIVTQERQIAQLNTDHATDSLDFLKNKFTNAELYRFIGNILERSYSYMLNLSTAIAKTAESQLYFERQAQAGPFILDDYWETPSAGSIAGSGDSTDRRGLTGSARLAVDITRLDQYAFETNKRKLQMTKIISLAQNFPSEFQQFKETGVITFALTNKLFDYDFPGHYLRLINSVKTTVVALVPVYDSIKATLTASNLSYTVIGGTTFQKVPIKRMEVDSVALTSANSASGVFEMQPMQNEFLNPFEGMGAESLWEFKLPQFSNRFDFTNIADVLLTVEYTALDSYQYRYQVLQDLDNSLSFNRGFSIKNNFPDQWYELADVQSGTPDFGITFELKRDFFPQGIDNLRLNGSSLVLYFARENGFVDEIEVLDFNLTSNTAQLGGETIDGKLTSTIDVSGTPVINLRLVFENNFTNRELFTNGQVTDILLLVGCKADLRTYPV